MRRSAPWRLVAAALALATAAHAERIRTFASAIDVRADGTLDVEERIEWDFEGAVRHGVFRDVPLAYPQSGGTTYHLLVRVEGATDAHGVAWPVHTERANGMLRIRIGDPARTVTGRQDYWLRYRVERALLFFDDHDELYWNATGTEWPVPIDHAQARVTLPPAGEGRVDVACYTGWAGSREQACAARRSGDVATFATSRDLGVREGLTIVVGVPKGVLRAPTPWQRAAWWLRDTGVGWLAIPALVLGAMTARWRHAGRDPVVAEAVAVRYEPPPGLTPAEVGTIYDERADVDDVTSTILDLAIRGWLRIDEEEADGLLFFSRHDYRLTRLPAPAGQRLKPHEAQLLTGLFAEHGDSVLVSALRDRFYQKLPGIRRALYDVLSGRDGYFDGAPDRVRDRYVIGALALAAPAFFVLQGFGPVACAAFVLAGLVVAGFARAMPRRTRKGRDAYEEIVGLREFIRRVEADRLERLGGRTAGTFESVLPFAVVLGVADRWADAFAGIYTTPPAWYGGHFDGATFQPHDLVRDVGRSLDSMGRAFTSTPRGAGSRSSGFGGGGSSGGGFGGGGGGSW